MKRIVTVVVTVAALIAAHAALAGGSTVLNGYGSSSAKPTIKVAAAVAKSTSEPAPAVASAGTLPFTGTDLGIVAIAGVALVGLGFGLRRVGRDQNKA